MSLSIPRKVEGMEPTRMIDLQTFNDRVRECQEEAYHLACELLSDMDEAAEVVGAAVLAAYRERTAGEDCRLRVLHWVAKDCQPKARMQGLDSSGIHQLPFRERLAVLLVDGLGLNYAQAAQVMDQPRSGVAAILAQGRARLCG